MRWITPLLALLFLLPATPARGQGDARAVRQDLLRRINEERREAGAPPLRLSEPLSRAAQWHAGEIARRGSLRLPAGTTEAMRQTLKRVGYEAHAWTEGIATSTGGTASVMANWRRGDPQVYRAMLDPEVRDLGLGLDRLDGLPLYVFLFAVPQADHFTRETMGLRDLAQVRAAVLARVNAERRRAGVSPLKANPLLDRAAQRHAEDMLRRGYFAHESPEGDKVRERARDAGYDWRAIGENIALGQTSVDEVMDTWMKSPGHRRNILDPDFKELGVGLALGRSGDSHRVLWAQAFGTRR